jgi:hypothetical protein
MEWFESFDDVSQPLVLRGAGLDTVARNDKFEVEALQSNGAQAFSNMLGQYAIGSNNGFHIVPVGANPQMQANEPRGSSPMPLWTNHSLSRTDRRVNDLGIQHNATLPPWDDRMPCGSELY